VASKDTWARRGLGMVSSVDLDDDSRLTLIIFNGNVNFKMNVYFISVYLECPAENPSNKKKSGRFVYAALGVNRLSRL
jgi:hypothetical protein